MVSIAGGCHCGAVRYEAEVDPERVSICHCTDCQALTGSAFRVTVSTPRQAVRITAGELRVYAKRGDNGRVRFQHFCGDCGSPLFTSGEGEDAATWGIRWGSIAERRALTPTRQIWRRSAVEWLGQVDDLPAHERD